MKPRSLAVLALLVAGLAAFLWFGRELPSSEEMAARDRKVLPIEADDVVRLEVEWDDRVVSVERAEAPSEADDEDTFAEPREWSLRRPLEARADSGRVDGLVRRLVELEKERTLEEVSRADVGLAEPRGRIRVATADAEYTLEVGAEVPASSNMTVAVGGEEAVYVVAAAIWPDLAKEAGEWRDKSLFRGQRADIERIALESEGRRVLLARRGDGFWIESPLVDRADETLVNSLLTAVTALRAERFVEATPEAAADRGLEPPRATVEVVLAGREAPLVVALGAAESEEPGAATYLRVDGETVVSPPDLVEHATRPAEEWQSKDLVAGEVYELDRLEIEDAGGTTVLARAEGDWLRDGVRIDYEVATDLLYEISGGRAERLVAGDALGDLGEPVLTFRLVTAAGAESGAGSEEVLRLYAPVGGETPTRASDRPGLLLLSAETAAALVAKLELVRAAAAQPDEAPEDGAPEDRAPEDGAPVGGAPENGVEAPPDTGG